MEQMQSPSYPTHWFDEDSYGRIIMRGKDALALLQRLTTNDMLRLGQYHGNQTVLTTPIGRIIDVLHVVHIDADVWVFTSADQGPAIYRHLKKNIFFNDAVTLAPAARSHRQIAIYGDEATTVVEQLMSLSLRDVPLWHAVTAADMMAMRIAAVGGSGWRVVMPAEHPMPEVVAALPQLSAQELSDWQVEAGIPAFGAELSEEYIPLEAGLERAISFNKGCYVGQEIIARMESRGRRAKQLSRVQLSAPVATPAMIRDADGQSAGVLTRMVDSTRYGMILGLAYINSKVAPDARLLVESVDVKRLDSVTEEVTHE